MYAGLTVPFSFCLSACSFVFLLICLSECLPVSVHLSVYARLLVLLCFTSFCLSVCLSVDHFGWVQTCPSVVMSVSWLICSSLCLCTTAAPSPFLSVWLSVSPSVHVCLYCLSGGLPDSSSMCVWAPHVRPLFMSQASISVIGSYFCLHYVNLGTPLVSFGIQ